MTAEQNKSSPLQTDELLDALEACRDRFRREIADDDFLRGFFGDEISPQGLRHPFLIPQHGCIPEFLKVCTVIDKVYAPQ